MPQVLLTKANHHFDMTSCRQQAGADNSSGCVCQEAESSIEELSEAHGMVQQDGSVHLANNEAIVLDAIKPKL